MSEVQSALPGVVGRGAVISTGSIARERARSPGSGLDHPGAGSITRGRDLDRLDHPGAGSITRERAWASAGEGEEEVLDDLHQGRVDPVLVPCHLVRGLSERHR